MTTSDGTSVLEAVDDFLSCPQVGGKERGEGGVEQSELSSSSERVRM